jgi:membrane protease subunit HflK
VTRQRLYIEAVEDVMTSSTKIMIDVEGGNNMLYLPLDNIMEQHGRGLGGASSTQDLRALAEQLSPYMPSANNNSNSIDRSRVPTNTRGVR